MRKLEKTILLPVAVVFIAVMAVVVISFVMARNNVRKELNLNAAEYADATRGAVKDRLSIFEETLRAGVGLFAGNGTVTKDQFSRFINTSAVLERYAGAQSVAYAKVVPATGLGDFTVSTRATVDPNYAIYPAGTRDSYTPVLYIEPQSESNKKVIGFDISSESIRQKALIAARDSGEVTISDAIQSVVDTSQDGRAFVMYAPQYKVGMPTSTVEERRAAIEGYIYSGFRVSRFLETVAPNNETEDISFKISIGDEQTELYKDQNYDRIANRNHAELTSDLPVGSNTFKFTYVYDEAALIPTTTSRPISILIFGFVTAILVAGGVWLILRGKASELLLEQERGINEAKDNLLSLASHQLRTPATGVKQYIGLLMQGFAGDVTAQQQQLLEKAYAGNERQLKTINDVLYMARLGSGRIVLSKSDFSVEQLARDITRELHQEVANKKHKLKLDAPKKQRRFYGDEHMIRMAIENLVTNAIKYTRDGGNVTVRLKYGRDNLVVTVEDDGLGIDKTQQDRLFRQFERIDNDLSIAVGGSGIGLYVVRNIASLHDGHVEVSSELGKGSRFTIVLPYKQPE